MLKTINRSRCEAAVALSVMLALPMAASADHHKKDAGKKAEQKQQQQAEKEQEKKNQQKQQVRKLKIFELEHRTPQEMAQLLRIQSSQPVTHAPPGAAAAARTQTGYRGVPQPTLVVAVDAEEDRLLFVRGPEEKISEIEELIESFDAPADKIEERQVGKVHLIPIRNGKEAKVHAILSQLEIPNQMLKLGEAGLIAVPASKQDQMLSQAKQVIAKLGADSQEKQPKNSDQKQKRSDQNSDSKKSGSPENENK